MTLRYRDKDGSFKVVDADLVEVVADSCKSKCGVWLFKEDEKKKNNEQETN